MEFIKLNTFQYKEQLAPKSQLSGLKAVQKKNQKNKISSMKFSHQAQSLFCGMSDGSLVQFTQKKYSQKKLTQNKQYQTRYFNFPNAHKGQIKILLFQKIFDQNFVISGSADRTIKIWDIQPKSKDIVQTLNGHSGTVLTMVYSKKTDTLFSGSTDKTIRIWKQDESRKYFLYPWYTCYQTISEFISKKIQNPVYPTAFDLHDGQITNFTLYMGDSAGNLHIIKQIQIPSMEQGFSKPRTAFQIDKSNYNYHRLAITAIVYVAKQHLVITSSFDQNIYVFQSLSDKLLLKFYNPRKVNFTSLIWYKNMVVASDEIGVLYCLQINSDKGVEQIRKYNSRINQLASASGQSDLFILTDEVVDAARIIKGIKAIQGDNCHTQSIIGMFSLQVNKLTQNKIKDQAKIITVSLDNTMRVWDPTDLTCLQVLKNPQKCQITCLFYLKRANLFVTGHDNGIVRLWNIQLQTSITISQQDNPYAHTNSICAFTEYIYVRSNDDITQYMFSTGYQGKINVWQIFIKKSVVQSTLMSSTICPQLKFSFFPDQNQQNQEQIGHQLFSLEIWQNKKDTIDSQVYILSAGTKGKVYFTKMFSYQTEERQIHDDTINCMLIDQNILFTGGFDSKIKLTSLDNFQLLICLEAHQEPITSLIMIEQTGHLISKSSEGHLIIWDYPKKKIIKKIKQKKQRIVSLCYVDQTQMMYFGTEQAKILSYSLDSIYQNKVLKGTQLIFEGDTQKMLKIQEEQIAKLLKM